VPSAAVAQKHSNPARFVHCVLRGLPRPLRCREMDLREIAIVLVKLMWSGEVRTKHDPAGNFKRVRPASESTGPRFKYMDAATTLT